GRGVAFGGNLEGRVGMAGGRESPVSSLRRCDFIPLRGGTGAAWPLAARAQQRPMPLIGFLNPASPDTLADFLRGFHRGLKEAGYVEGENVAIVYRWADNQVGRLPELAAELVRREVAVFAATGGVAPRWQPRRLPRQSPLSLWSAKTRSSLVLS